jgi:hypothetical protein
MALEKFLGIPDDNRRKLENISSAPGLEKRIEAILDIIENKSMVDTAIPKKGKPDKRKCRKTRWQEARLCFSRGGKSINTYAPLAKYSLNRLSTISGDKWFKAKSNCSII